MSRIGKKPIPVPAEWRSTIDGTTVRVKGPNGSWSGRCIGTWSCAARATRSWSSGRATRGAPALHGLSRTLVANMVEGVTSGFKKTLEIVGVGYRRRTSRSG
jgi:large subunit ribosomal protein L6